MKNLSEALRIISGGKRFDFEDGENGSTVLVISDYWSGEELRLDLAKLTGETLAELQVETEPNEWED